MHYLQYVVGLRDMGHDVLYLEDTGTWYYDAASDGMVGEPQVFVTYLCQTMERFGLSDNWCFVSHEGQAFGISEKKLSEFVRTADLFLNVTGAGMVRDKYMTIPRRAYIDTDPAFIQFRLAEGETDDLQHLSAHTNYFTFGHNIGRDDCLIPTAGFDWVPTRQPILSSFWSRSDRRDNGRFTTIMKWKSYDPVDFEGERFGLKDLELERFKDLPKRCDSCLELSVAGHPPTVELEARGWRFKPAADISGDIDSYRSYIHASKGEWSVAKHAYVRTRSGWFSERSACYLASGRPVAVQETGFSDWMRTGLGVVPFSDVDEAAWAIQDISSRYDLHCAAAVEIAEEYFRSDKVLGLLLDAALG